LLVVKWESAELKLAIVVVIILVQKRRKFKMGKASNRKWGKRALVYFYMQRRRPEQAMIYNHRKFWGALQQILNSGGKLNHVRY